MRTVCVCLIICSILKDLDLKSQESALTGESVPVEKIEEAIEDDEVGVGDRKNMLFSSSLVTYGRGKGIVVETGMNTEVGKIAKMINETEDEATPLQIKLNNLGKTLGIVALVICAIIFVVGILYGKAPLNMFMTAVSLAVAAIPDLHSSSLVEGDRRVRGTCCTRSLEGVDIGPLVPWRLGLVHTGYRYLGTTRCTHVHVRECAPINQVKLRVPSASHQYCSITQDSTMRGSFVMVQ